MVAAASQSQPTDSPSTAHRPPAEGRAQSAYTTVSQTRGIRLPPTDTCAYMQACLDASTRPNKNIKKTLPPLEKLVFLSAAAEGIHGPLLPLHGLESAPMPLLSCARHAYQVRAGPYSGWRSGSRPAHRCCVPSLVAGQERQSRLGFSLDSIAASEAVLETGSSPCLHYRREGRPRQGVCGRGRCAASGISSGSPSHDLPPPF